MLNEENALLRNEIVRLNKIITVLIKNNDLLNAEIAVLKKGNTLKDASNAVSDFGNGNNESDNAFDKILNGNSDINNAIAEIWNGNIKSGSTVTKIGNGNSDERKGVPENGNGNPYVAQPLPAFIEASPQMQIQLQTILKGSGFNKVRSNAIRNAALLLLHFHNKNSGDHSELQKLTGLSKFGMAKFIGSLKKRGLVVRTGWQQFSITQSGERMVRAAWEKCGMA